MKGIFGCLRLQASRAMATQAMETNSTAEEAHGIQLENKIPADNATNSSEEAHGIQLENKISADNTTNTSDEPQPRVSPVNETDSDEDPVQNNAQAGVQKMEATTQVWSKKHLVAAYVM
jgi:hypothetical protein